MSGSPNSRAADSGVSLLVCERNTFLEKNTHGRMHFLTNLCQFFKMGSANVRLRHFVTGFSLSKGVRVMVECNPIKKISAWQLQGEGIRSNFQPSCQIKVVLKWSFKGMRPVYSVIQYFSSANCKICIQIRRKIHRVQKKKKVSHTVMDD